MTKNLFEKIQDVLYHSTGISNLRKILEENVFRLSSVVGTNLEFEFAKGKKYYFLSTTRSKLGDYHVKNVVNGTVLIVLNAEKLKRKGFWGHPVNYWYQWDSTRKVQNEMEDRIFSSKPEIGPATDFIEEIHILIDIEEARKTNSSLVEEFKDVLRILLKRKIPIFVYAKKIAFFLLDKRRAFEVPVSALKKEIRKVPLPDVSTKEKRKSFREFRENTLKGIYELLVKPVSQKKNLSNSASSALKYLLYYPKDFSSIFRIEMFNNRMPNRPERKYVEKIIDFMIRNSLKSPEDVKNFLENKWKKE
jgi:hypothetical protein